MKIDQVMTRDVITTRPEARVEQAARLMVDHGVSGLPVVADDGRVVGVVSEGDLIRRQTPPDRVSWWRRFFEDPAALARDYQKRAGTTVADVMTREVISVGSTLPVEAAAAIIERHRIRRVPVIDQGRLVGLVSRGDLIKTLAAVVPAREGTPPPDTALVAEMQRRLGGERWVVPHSIVVHANAGQLVLWGWVDTDAQRAAIETMARGIPGVRGVENHITPEQSQPYHYGP